MASFNQFRLNCLLITITTILTACGGGGGADASSTSNGGFTTTNTKPQVSSEASAATSSIVGNVNNAENEASSTPDNTSSAASSVVNTSSAVSEISSPESSTSNATSSQPSSSGEVTKSQSSKSSTSSSVSSLSSSKSSTSSSRSSLSSSRSSTSSSRSSLSSSKSSSSSSKPSLDTTPPSQPDTFATQLVRYDIVILKWDDASDNVGIAFYNLYRDGVLLDRLPSTENVYYDYDVASSRTYTYSITAGDIAGNWSSLSFIEVKTPSLPVITISSAASSALSTSSASPVTSSASSVSSVNSTTSASSAASLSSASSSSASASSKAPVVDTTIPTSPGDVLKLHASTAQVDISWTTATDNVGVTAYRVYRDGTLLKTYSADVFTYSDKTVAPDTSYWFGVSAGDAAGNWSLQKLLNIKTPPVSAGTVILQWEPPTQRENGAILLPIEIGGYNIRYKTPQESSFHYVSANKLDRQLTISNLKGENTFQISVFDTNGRPSYFATIEPK